jgi:phosphoserine phosphatase RsbU/P
MGLSEVGYRFRGKHLMTNTPAYNDLHSTLILRILSEQTSDAESFRTAAELVLQLTASERCYLFTQEGRDASSLRIVWTPEGEMGEDEVPGEVRRAAAKVINRKEASTGLVGEEASGPEPITVLSQLSVVCAPIASQEVGLGALCVVTGRPTPRLIEQLNMVAAIIAARAERDYGRREKVEIRRIKYDLDVASAIQQRLQPVSPKLVGWEIAANSEQMFGLGGDYYDFIQRKKDGRVIVAVGDVSGKGLGAALVMVLLRTVVQMQSHAGSHLDENMDEINLNLFESTPSNMFATLFLAHINLRNDLLTYCNAGHNPPILVRRDGTAERLETGGVPAGLFPGAFYEEAVVSITPGDVLVIYTDGYSEAVNDMQEQFGDLRLAELVQENREKSAPELLQLVEEQLKTFTGDEPLTDDRTLVILKRVVEESAGISE